MKPAPPPVHMDEAVAIRLLFETEDRQCDGQGRTCPVAPVWGFDCLGCGHMVRCCGAHRDWLDRRVEHGDEPWCRPCSTDFPRPLPWVPL